MIRAGQLQGARIVDEAGRRIGTVAELHLKDGRVDFLADGAGGALQRFWPWRGGGRIAWAKVVRFEPGLVVINKDAPGAGRR